MAFSSRRLLPQYPTYSSYSSSPSPSPSNAISCPFPCYGSCTSDALCSLPYSSPPPPPSPILLPPPPLLFPPPPRHRFPLLSTRGILAFSIVSSLFLLTVYFILLVRSRRNRPNNRSPRQGPPPQPEDGGQWGQGEEWNQNLAMVHPIWLINTVGLQPAVIDSIAVCEFKKSEGLIEGDHCSICLGDFEEGESLRLLPKCSHAFHIPCIDTWLRSHTNCPLCRAPIMAPAHACSSVAALEPTGSGSGGREDLGENTEGGDTAGDDTGGSGGGPEGGNVEEGLNDKSIVEEVEVGASVGRRSVSMDGIASAALNLDREGNQRGRIGGVRSLPGSRRFCRPGSGS